MEPAGGKECVVPPNSNLQITLELLSWKTVSEVTTDNKVIKKILKEGEGYDRPNDGAIVQGLLLFDSLLVWYLVVMAWLED